MLEVLGVGDRAERLEGHVQAFLRAEFVLEDMRRRRERLVDVAAAQFGIEREIGVALALEMLEVGEGAGGLELLVDVSLGGHRLDFVIDRLELLVFGGDRLRRRLGDMRIGGEHDRDRLADKAHFVDRHDRLIVKGRSVIGLRDDLDDVFRRDDSEHAGNFLRRADVDRFDAAMRHRAAEDFSVQHARKPHQVRVFGAAGDLFAGFEPRHRAADLPAAYSVDCHQGLFASIVTGPRGFSSAGPLRLVTMRIEFLLMLTSPSQRSPSAMPRRFVSSTRR